MKKGTVCILLTCLFVSMSFGTYYEITTDIYTPGLTLQTGDSLYMLNGGFGSLNLLGEDVTATIDGTSPLEQFVGGIWFLNLSNNGHLEMNGGEVHMIDFDDDATAILKGGLIGEIRIDQTFFLPDGIPHITLYYLGDLPILDASNILTGSWGNGESFAIQLVNDTGVQCDLLDNFNFVLVPEPITLALLGLGGLLIRRKKT